VSEKQMDLDPYSTFIFAINADRTREKYTCRLDRFLLFIGVQGHTVKERCNYFYETAKADDKCALNNIMRFLQFYKQRVQNRGITGATARNYVKSIKLFCEMNDIRLMTKKNERSKPTKC
jgi:hypothetical protein